MREKIDHAVDGLEEYCHRLRTLMESMEHKINKDDYSDDTKEGINRFIQGQIDKMNKFGTRLYKFMDEMERRSYRFVTSIVDKYYDEKSRQSLVDKYYEGDHEKIKSKLVKWMGYGVVSSYELGRVTNVFHGVRCAMYDYMKVVNSSIDHYDKEGVNKMIDSMFERKIKKYRKSEFK